MADFLYFVQFEDSYGRKSSKRYRITAADFAAARLIADTLLAAIQNLTEGGMNYEQLGQQTQIAAAAAAGANVDEGMSLKFQIAPGKTSTQTFPMPVKTVVQPDGTIDVTNALVVAYAAPFLAGDVLISDGEVADVLLSGVLDK